MGWGSTRGSTGALALAALLAAPALADRGQGPFEVSVTVPPQVTLESLDAPSLLAITADDVARGYKDISARYRVRHNVRRGYLLQIAPRSGLAREVRVSGLGAEVVLHDEAAEIHRSGEAFEQELALGFRFVLAAGVHPGTFELPVQLAPMPL